jgi:hypothetical protein
MRKQAFKAAQPPKAQTPSAATTTATTAPTRAIALGKKNKSKPYRRVRKPDEI